MGAEPRIASLLAFCPVSTGGHPRGWSGSRWMEQRGEEAVVSISREENSLGALHKMKGQLCSIGSLLQPSVPCTKSLLSPKKGRVRKGLAVPTNGYSSHYTTSAAVARPALSSMWKCTPLIVPQGTCNVPLFDPKGQLIRASWVGKENWAHHALEEKQRNHLKALPFKGNSARLCFSPCRL